MENLGLEMKNVSLSEWQSTYNTLVNLHGFESVATINTEVATDDEVNNNLLEAINQYPPTEYQLKFKMTNRRNIIVFARKHKVGAFRKEAERYAEIWDRMKRSMHNGGWILAHMVVTPSIHLKEYLEEQYMDNNHEIEWVTVTLTNHYYIKALFIKKIHSVELQPVPMDELATPSKRGMYKERIVGRIDKQNDKGIDKYPQALEDDEEMGINERLDHFADELVDGLQYIEHLRDGFECTIQKQIELTAAIMSMASRTTGARREEVLELSRMSNDITKGLVGIAKNK